MVFVVILLLKAVIPNHGQYLIGTYRQNLAKLVITITLTFAQFCICF